MPQSILRRSLLTLGLCGATFTAPALAWAHPGHGGTDPQTVAHYAFEPIHALPVVALLLAGIAFRVMLLRTRRERARVTARK